MCSLDNGIMVMLTHQFANSCNFCYTNLKTFNHLTRGGGGGGGGGGGKEGIWDFK